MSGRPLTEAQQTTLAHVEHMTWIAGRTLHHVAADRLTLTVQGPAWARGAAASAITGTIGKRGGLVLEDVHGRYRGEQAEQLLRTLVILRRG